LAESGGMSFRWVFKARKMSRTSLLAQTLNLAKARFGSPVFRQPSVREVNTTRSKVLVLRPREPEALEYGRTEQGLKNLVGFCGW